MQRYFDHICGIRNIRDMDTWDQMCYVAERFVGRRLRYSDLTEDNGKDSGANTGEGEIERWRLIREAIEWENEKDSWRKIGEANRLKEAEMEMDRIMPLFEIFNE